MKVAHLKIKIGELVLDGFASADRYRIREALEGELVQLFSQNGVPPWVSQGGEIAGLDGGAFEIGPDSHPKAVGAQIARAVHRGFQR